MSDRIDDLKKDGYLLDQGAYNFCGFAAAISSMLEHDQGEVDKLYNSVKPSGSGFYKNTYTKKVPPELKDRLAKREKLNLIDSFSATDPVVDVWMGIGLMIVFKEYLKKISQTSIWTECEDFSKAFTMGTWKYSDTTSGNPKGKLKNFISNPPKISPALDFTYKHGDLALTMGACKKLLEMIYDGKNGSLTLNSTEEFTTSFLPNSVTSSVTQKNDKYLYQYLKQSGKRGIILAMGKSSGKFSGTADSTSFLSKNADKYYHIIHIVYAPQSKNQSITDPKNTIVWTWGKTNTLEEHATGKVNATVPLLPVYAIGFELT